MDKDKQRIAIAKACGWHSFQLPTEAMPHLLAMKGPLRGFMPVPHYLSDLNVMHDVEESIKRQGEEEWMSYVNVLHGRLRSPFWDSCHVTAAAKAEAFLRYKHLWTPTGEENE